MKLDERLKKVRLVYLLGIFLSGCIYGEGENANRHGRVIAYAALGDHKYTTEEAMNEKLQEMSKLLEENFPGNLAILRASSDALAYCRHERHYEQEYVEIPNEDGFYHYFLAPNSELKSLLEPLGLWGVL